MLLLHSFSVSRHHYNEVVANIGKGFRLICHLSLYLVSAGSFFSSANKCRFRCCWEIAPEKAHRKLISVTVSWHSFILRMFAVHFMNQYSLHCKITPNR